MNSDGNDESVIVRVIRQAAPPSFISEANSLEALGIPGDEWFDFLRKAGVAYKRHKELHIAAAEDAARALREGADRRPGPPKGTVPKKSFPKKDATPAELLEGAGFKRSGTG